MSGAYIAGITPERPDQALSRYHGLLPRKLTMAEISERVARARGLSLDALRGPTTTRVVTAARHEAMWRCYQTGRYSNQQIGTYFGHRDHTSVIHARATYQARLGEEALAA